MFKRKKTIAILLASLLVISSILTGCGGTKKTDGGDKDASKKETTEKMKLHVFGPAKTSKYIKFDERDKYPVWKEVQKMIDEANLDIEYELVPAEQYDVVIKTKMASGSGLPDIVNISALDNTTALNLAKQGTILELNSLIDKYDNGNIKKMYNETFPFAKKLTTSADGKMYWFSNLHKKTYKGTEPAPVALTMLIRKDWLDKLNLPVPTTAEEYLQTLKKMKENDANGNGTKDEVLYYDPSMFNGAIAQWFGLGTDITSVDVDNNKVVSPWYQPGIKDYFAYLQRLVKEGILDTSLVGSTWEQRQQKVIENKISSLHEYNLADYLEPTIKGAEKPEYIPLMPLKAKDGIEPAAQLEPPFLVWLKYAVTKDCKNPEAAIKFFDIIYSEKYANLGFWGIEGETYKKNEDGANVFINNGSEEEQAASGKVTGNQLFGDTVFPRIQFSNLEYELDPNRVSKARSDHELKIMGYKPYFPSMNTNFLAIPSEEQLEEKTKILNNLTTYSTELATKLALGQKSLNDWDQYMAELKKLGLDRLIEIDQQLFDRYNSLN